MTDEDDKNDDSKKVIHFPQLEQRDSIRKAKKTADKEEKKAAKERERLERQYRRSYRIQKAQEQSNQARASANGKTPFINWDKIPMFTRIAVGLFFVVQLLMYFVPDPGERLYIVYNFGFVPAIYSGAAEWNWTALLSPFTSLILHGGWMHLLFNTVMMMAMGVFFERQFGAQKTLKFFLLCGMAGHLAYLFLNPTSNVPVIGASGAISGLFAVTILIMIERGLVGPEAQKRGPLPFILLWTTLIIVIGLISSDTSWQSHLGGFLGGVGLFQLWKKGRINL